MTIEDLTRRYFECVRAQDAKGLAALFAEDGALISLDGRRIEGPGAILTWYESVFAQGAPNPQVHALAVDGRISFAEIVGRRPDGSEARIIDRFLFDAEDRIAEMAVYLGPGAR